MYIKTYCFDTPGHRQRCGGFWKGFGRALGGQNPRFSQFFRCFFDVIFQARFGRRKNREKMRKKQTFPLFGVGFAVVPRPLGKGKDRGFEHFRSNCAKECRDWPAVIGQSQLEMNPARRWHTFGGRRIESPQGRDIAGHPLRGFSPIAALTWKHRHSRQTSCDSARSWPLFSHECPNDAGQVGGKVFATRKHPQASFCDIQNLRKLSPDPPKWSPAASKIEPGALEYAIF